MVRKLLIILFLFLPMSVGAATIALWDFEGNGTDSVNNHDIVAGGTDSPTYVTTSAYHVQAWGNTQRAYTYWGSGANLEAEHIGAASAWSFVSYVKLGTQYTGTHYQAIFGDDVGANRLNIVDSSDWEVSKIYVEVGGASNSFTWTYDTNYHQFNYEWNGSTVKVYVDGVEKYSIDRATNPIANNVAILYGIRLSAGQSGVTIARGLFDKYYWTDTALGGTDPIVDATATITATITYTQTESITPTITLTQSQTSTMTITPTLTRTMTETVTQTATPTQTQSVTETITATMTRSVTETITLTATPTITPSVTLTVTPTISWTVTQTITPTLTPTVTLTPVLRISSGTLKSSFLTSIGLIFRNITNLFISR